MLLAAVERFCDGLAVYGDVALTQHPEQLPEACVRHGVVLVLYEVYLKLAVFQVVVHVDNRENPKGEVVEKYAGPRARDTITTNIATTHRSHIPFVIASPMMKLPILANSMFVFRSGARPATAAANTSQLCRLASTSSLANGTPAPRRRAVTIANDTGRVPWNQLSIGEKAARTTQQSFNVGLVLLGLGATGAVATVLYLEVFSTDSKTAVFNRAADRVRKDSRCLELLAGEGIHNKREISAYGEPSWSRWARNRTIASRAEKDRAGTDHMHMHFYVEGPVAKGTVNVHMTKRPGEKDFEYRTLALDVPGQQRYFLEDADAAKLDQRKQGKMFGVRWN